MFCITLQRERDSCSSFLFFLFLNFLSPSKKGKKNLTFFFPLLYFFCLFKIANKLLKWQKKCLWYAVYNIGNCLYISFNHHLFLTGSQVPIKIVLLLRGRAKKWWGNSYSSKPLCLWKDEGETSGICGETGRAWFDLHKSIGGRRWPFFSYWSGLAVNIFNQRQEYSGGKVC